MAADNEVWGHIRSVSSGNIVFGDDFFDKRGKCKGERKENEDFHLFLDQDKTVLKCPSGLKRCFPRKKTLEISDIVFFQC